MREKKRRSKALQQVETKQRSPIYRAGSHDAAPQQAPTTCLAQDSRRTLSLTRRLSHTPSPSPSILPLESLVTPLEASLLAASASERRRCTRLRRRPSASSHKQRQHYSPAYSGRRLHHVGRYLSRRHPPHSLQRAPSPLSCDFSRPAPNNSYPRRPASFSKSPLGPLTTAFALRFCFGCSSTRKCCQT